MAEDAGAGRPVVYLFGSAAGVVTGIEGAVRAGLERGWDVALGLTPTAREWLAGRGPELEGLTGHPVKSAYRRPGQPDVLPHADAVLFAPATFHSVNSLALGLTSSWVVGYAAEAAGKGVPVLLMPCVNTALAAHPQFPRSVAALREAGVQVLLGAGGFVPNEPGAAAPYPWDAALDAVARALAERAARGNGAAGGA
ncbi:flavoprotein [Kitasatospora sp. NRRL B-11411]|uniref:flavoprotein n=1 Tax=Kitasatospora sp. NRRL B-11411 TaxID=1463822 RepID=UPI0004C422C5|nr:flavoprotein [Kitasatospora sp. NRRL B-11411]